MEHFREPDGFVDSGRQAKLNLILACFTFAGSDEDDPVSATAAVNRRSVRVLQHFNGFNIPGFNPKKGLIPLRDTPD